MCQVPIYKEFHKNVIGKGGANIRKIREETSTRIDLPPEGSDSDMIVITGRKEDVEKARDRILKIQSELVRHRTRAFPTIPIVICWMIRMFGFVSFQ